MTPCPTPKKKRFRNKELALLSAAQQGKSDLNAYLCPCGGWHQTKLKSVAPEVDEQFVSLLAGATDEQFVSLVRAEGVGKATSEEAAALRSDALVRRWDDALNTILYGYQQLINATRDRNDAATVRWRANQQDRVMRYATRRKECRALRRDLLRRQLEERQSRGERRRSPRSRALDRLIEAHREEFDRLIKEEEEEEQAPFEL